MKSVLALAEWFWPDWFLTAWAVYAMTLGSIMALLATRQAIADHIGRRPLTDMSTDKATSPAGSFLFFLMFGGGGALFAALGFLVLVWKSA